MNRLTRSIFVIAILAAPCIATAQDVQGDVLLIERVQEEPANLPGRGMSMSQVEARFGAPSDRLDPRGGQKRDWPTINRWTYPAFNVADSAITVGAVLLILDSFRQRRADAPAAP